MLVVISDVHMTDRATGSPVTNDELVGFVEEISKLASKTDALTLLLLGDIFDYLRSELWGELHVAQPGCAPWNNLVQDFTNFADSPSEKEVLRIQDRIEERYSGFAKALADLKKERPGMKIHYVYGNHDYLLQLSQPLRQKVVNFLRLDEDPKKKFELTYEDRSLSVYAEHGHRHDIYNWHDEKAALWAIGDAIVIRVVNRFGELATKELYLTDEMPLGRAVHEIDNVEPQTLIPLYVKWLANSSLAGQIERGRLYACWRKAVKEFLDLDEFKESRYGALRKKIRVLRNLYGLLDEAKIAAMLPSFDQNYARKAHLETTTDAILRVYGHTHGPGIHPLDLVAGQQRYYVNTGTWRRVVTHVDIDDTQHAFGGYRIASYLVVRGPGDFSLHTRTGVG